MTASVDRALERLAIPARRLGVRWWAERCPMPGHKNQNEAHRWKNFFVRADGSRGAGLWHCFSCGAGGHLVDLVMKVRGCEFREAAAWLRDVEEAPAPEPVVRVRYETLSGASCAFELPPGVEQGPFDGWNSVPRGYAISRGIVAAQVERWEIGYALGGRLDGRIVFPIRDCAGRLCNYAARTFAGDETRYLAAHEREGPDVSAMLGEARWPSTRERARRTAVVFEGAVTGMALERALERAGIAAELAGLQGSNVAHPRRTLKLSAFGRVVSAADPDAAGDRASLDLEAALRGVPFLRLRYPSRRDAADTPEGEMAAALTEQLGCAG